MIRTSNISTTLSEMILENAKLKKRAEKAEKIVDDLSKPRTVYSLHPPNHAQDFCSDSQHDIICAGDCAGACHKPLTAPGAWRHPTPESKEAFSRCKPYQIIIVRGSK